MEFNHVSVLFDETIEALNALRGGLFVDGTLGGGGHTNGILSACADTRVIGIDRDTDALAAAEKRLSKYGDRFCAVHDNFSNIKNILSQRGIDKIDGAVLDLGVSSYQLDEAERGFSYMHDAPLDMRMNREDTLTAYDVVNTYSPDELMKIFYEYGEEKWSKRIAEFIVKARAKEPVKTTGELSDIISAAIPAGARADGGHPAKRVFQAIRIEVNGELKILEGAARDFAMSLKSGGRLAIITFHSLEDRIIKNTFKALCTDCICPKSFPVCVCGHKAEGKLLTRKPILPSENEQKKNPRSKSAKLRVFVKI